AFCLRVCGLTRLTVRETLTLRALERARRTFPVFHLAGVPFEIPFRKVARKMGFADRVVRTIDRTLHEAKAALCGVRIGVAAHVLVGTVVDLLMAGKLFADVKVLTALVRHDG